MQIVHDQLVNIIHISIKGMQELLSIAFKTIIDIAVTFKQTMLHFITECP